MHSIPQCVHIWFIQVLCSSAVLTACEPTLSVNQHSQWVNDGQFINLLQAAVRVSGLELGGLVGSLIAGRASDYLISKGEGKKGNVGQRVKVRGSYTAKCRAAKLELAAKTIESCCISHMQFCLLSVKSRPRCNGGAALAVAANVYRSS